MTRKSQRNKKQGKKKGSQTVTSNSIKKAGYHKNKKKNTLAVSGPIVGGMSVLSKTWQDYLHSQYRSWGEVSSNTPSYVIEAAKQQYEKETVEYVQSFVTIPHRKRGRKNIFTKTGVSVGESDLRDASYDIGAFKKVLGEVNNSFFRS